VIAAIEAKDIALRYLQSLNFDGELVLVEDEIIEKTYGWVFFYTSAEYLKSRDITDAVAGNAPFLVERDAGHVTVFGTAHPISHYIADYENKRLHEHP
jgi:hypothetical protein